MASKRMWLTKKQLKQRAIIAAVVIAILIILGFWMFRPTGIETILEPKTEQSQKNFEQVGGDIEDETSQAETRVRDGTDLFAEQELLKSEENIKNSCMISLKHAEDEVLDAYNIKKKAESRLADLEEEMAEIQNDMAEADDLLEDSEEALDKLRDSCIE